MKEIAIYAVKGFSRTSLKGMPIAFNGKAMTNGEAVEIAYKLAKGLKPTKSANKAYDEEPDVPELGHDVKSWRAALTMKPLDGETLAEKLVTYRKNTKATAIVFGWFNDDLTKLTCYIMDAVTFEKFVILHGMVESVGNHRIRLRGGNLTSQNQMKATLESL